MKEKLTSILFDACDRMWSYADENEDLSIPQQNDCDVLVPNACV